MTTVAITHLIQNAIAVVELLAHPNVRRLSQWFTVLKSVQQWRVVIFHVNVNKVAMNMWLRTECLLSFSLL